MIGAWDLKISRCIPTVCASAAVFVVPAGTRTAGACDGEEGGDPAGEEGADGREAGADHGDGDFEDGPGRWCDIVPLNLC